MAAKFFALLTNQGAAKLSNMAALGEKLEITSLAVGDGGGVSPTPNQAQTELVNERRRAQLNSLSVDEKNTSQIIAEQIIPESVGGWWIREIGLFDADGVLIAVANCPETYKATTEEGSGRTQVIRMMLTVSSTDAVTLKVDPSVVLATRQYVDSAVIEVKTYADNVMKKHVAEDNPHSQYPLIENALKELADAGLVGEVLKNLGLGELPDSFGSAASKNVGTTAGTVAAGDDSRIVNAVQPSNPGLCTAWVNFNGNNPATIRSSFNVSSVTRLSTGKYQIIFGTPMENPDYAVSLTIGDGATSGTAAPIVAISGSSTTGDPVKKDTGGINITTRGSGGVYECSEVNAIFFGGK